MTPLVLAHLQIVSNRVYSVCNLFFNQSIVARGIQLADSESLMGDMVKMNFWKSRLGTVPMAWATSNTSQKVGIGQK